MSDAIVVFNAGSTSLKFAAYAVDAAGSLPLLCRGGIDGMQADPQFVVKNAAGKPLDAHEWGKGHAIDHKAALHFVITWLEANLADMKVVAAGHRVVLGGTRFEAPVLIDGEVLDYLESLAVMEPSHQPFNVRGARAIAEAFPGLPQVACFDTSFHRTMPEVAQTYALSEGRARCGRAPLGLPRHLLRLHQPAGAEIRAASAAGDRRASRRRRQHVRHAGRKERRDDDGLRGAVRPADGDALGRRAAGRCSSICCAASCSTTRRWKRCCTSARACSACPASAATCGCCRRARSRAAVAAVEYFVYAMTKYAGAYAAVLGGLDAFVFTAGIGEHSAPVRAALCGKLAWLGVKLDEQANASGGPRISTPDSRVSVWVIPTNEELMIAQHTLALVRPSPS